MTVYRQVSRHNRNERNFGAMTDGWKPPAPGALDDAAWSEHLLARAIDAGASDDRLHGYSVLGDVSRHYPFSDLIYLALVGELPDPRRSSLFALALFSFATPSVGEAPVHVAVLARMSGATMASALAAGSITVADQAQDLVLRHASLLSWLHAPASAIPSHYDGQHDPKVAALCERARAIDPASRIRQEMTIDAARLTLLYTSGVTSADQMIGAIVAARIAAISAEILATGPQHLRDYPVKVPEYRYTEADET
jgi:hypothetical protein